MKRSFLTLLVVILFSAIFAGVAFAQSGNPPTDDEVNAIAKQLYCPVCESTPLDVCPTEACRDWREQIRTMLADGKTEDEILQHFVDQYGDKVLASPPATGLNWFVYLLPPVIILAGAYLLFSTLKAWTKPKGVETSAGTERSEKKIKSTSNQDEYITRFEEEVKKRK